MTNRERRKVKQQESSKRRSARRRAEAVASIRRFLDDHKDEFEMDPEDDSFYVHRRIIEGVRKICPPHVSPFNAISDQYLVAVMMLQVPGQLEVFLANVPAVERMVFVKGDGICLLHLHPLLPWN